MEEWYVKANDMADVLAGQAAALHRVPNTTAEDINNIISKDFFDASCDYPLTQNEVEKVMSYIYKKNDIHHYIDTNIELTNNSDLSKYATSIKNFALTTIRQCIKYGVVDGVESVRHDAKRKMILINEEDYFFLG